MKLYKVELEFCDQISGIKNWTRRHEYVESTSAIEAKRIIRTRWEENGWESDLKNTTKGKYIRVYHANQIKENKNVGKNQENKRIQTN